MKRNREIVCGSLALLVSAAFLVGCLKIPGLSSMISSHGNINILVYGMTLVLFCVLFTAGMFLAGKMAWGMENPGDRPVVKWGLLILLTAGQALFFAVGMTKETGQVGSVSSRYVWHTQPLWLMLLVFVLGAGMFLLMYGQVRVSDGGEWMLYVLYGVLAVLIFYSMDTPNLFGRGEWGDNYHAHAYFNSIYNVHYGMPFSGELTSIYGHYALLWKLPMKLIGGDFRRFVLLLAALGSFTHVCAFLVLHQMVKSRLLKALGALAISFPILGMRGGYYWQLWPHRMVFPMILLLYAVFVIKRRQFGWKTALPGYLICVLGVVWNTETGMILAAAWAGVHMCYIFSEETLDGKRFAKGVVFHGLGVLGSFAGAYGLVNIYNIMKHSPVSTLKEFMLPLMSDSYMTDVLHLDLPLYPSAYMGVIVLFLMGTSIGIAGWRWFRRETQPVRWQNYLVFFLSVSALGRLVYYMNRPAYHNLDCCHLSAVILLAFFGEKGLRFIKEREWINIAVFSPEKIIKNSISTVCIVTLLAVASGTVLQFSQNSQIKENFHNLDEVEAFTSTVTQNVPANTFAFGIGVTEIYSFLHWNTQCFTMDFSDLFVAPQSAFTLETRLKEENIEQVFTSAASLPIWEDFNPEGYQWFCENYILDKTFTIGGQEFQYYIKI